MAEKLSEILSSFSNIISKIPVELRDPNAYKHIDTEEVKDLVKLLYDHTKDSEECSDKKTLPKLMIEGFDEEQIWQQLDIQNESFIGDAAEKISYLVAKPDRLKFPIKLRCNSPEKEVNKNKADETEVTDDYLEDEETADEEATDEEMADEESAVEEMRESADEESADEEMRELGVDKEEDSVEDKKISKNENTPPKKRHKTSVVDDKFFSLAELKQFLKSEERKEDKPVKETDSFNLFDDTGKETTDYKYSDFFGDPDDGSMPGETDNLDGSDEENVDLSDGQRNGKRKRKNSVNSEINADSDEELNDNECFDEDAEECDDEDMEEELSDNDAEEVKTSDKNNKRVRFALLDDEHETEEKSEHKTKSLFSGSQKPEKIMPKSSYEERQNRLGRVIGRLEDDAMSEKPWQLKGEVTASGRPENSLLEEVVEFDHSMRPAPVITEEVTLKLEDIILQRIKDKAWDDVERKVKPIETPSEFKKKLALDQEKSKLSLAEVYEEEFIKQREAATGDKTERQEVEPALHVETRSMLHTLFNKLDALSNYHFTPRPVAPELKVVSNVPALAMEEVAPIAVADSALLAPEEIKGKKHRGGLMSKEERTKTDKKRALRLKKTRQRQRQRERARTEKEMAKLNPGLGNKYSKMKVQKEILKSSSNISKMEESQEKVTKSSTAFFNKLQDEVKSQIQTKTKHLSKKKDKNHLTAKKLKL